MNAQTEASIRLELFLLEEELRLDRVLYEPDNAAAIRRCELLRDRLNSKNDALPITPPKQAIEVWHRADESPPDEFGLLDSDKLQKTSGDYSPWIDSPKMIALMKANCIRGTSDRNIGRKKQAWQAESQVGTNNQLFRFKLSILRQLGITYPPEWDDSPH